MSEGDIEEMFSIADQDKDGKICYQVNVEYKMDRITRFLSGYILESAKKIIIFLQYFIENQIRMVSISSMASLTSLRILSLCSKIKIAWYCLSRRSKTYFMAWSI